MVAQRIEYDEFAYFHENAAEYGIPWAGPPQVERRLVQLGDGREISALCWGRGHPQLVFLHGGAQNAHTWDTVALALKMPLLAVDLPGHGHSGPASAATADPVGNAPDIVAAIRRFADRPVHLVGMSLGGLTSLAVADASPELVRSVFLVDVTPGVNNAKSRTISEFVNGPERFDNFDELLARTVRFNPGRSESSLRRGILHNAMQLEDGTWQWRYARFGSERRGAIDFTPLWDAISRLKVPLCLARGMRAQSVVDDLDEEEVRRRQPAARIEHFAEAGHSLQGDTPLKLAALIEDFTGLRRLGTGEG
jgi:pimeloyl-ACP methyl ester carboxylesterase